MEEREQNKLCHLFMGHLGDESERKKASEHYQAKHKIELFFIQLGIRCGICQLK